MANKAEKKAKADGQKRRRAERRKAGLCVDCGKFPAEPGSTLCSIHKAQRADMGVRNYHTKRLKKAGMTPHEYDLRVQLAGGKCEAHCGNPITHFNFCPHTGKLRGLVCKGCDRVLRAFKQMPEDRLLNLAALLATFAFKAPMKALLAQEHQVPLVREALAQPARLNTQTISPSELV